MMTFQEYEKLEVGDVVLADAPFRFSKQPIELVITEVEPDGKYVMAGATFFDVTVCFIKITVKDGVVILSKVK